MTEAFVIIIGLLSDFGIPLIWLACVIGLLCLFKGGSDRQTLENDHELSMVAQGAEGHVEDRLG